MLHLRLEHKQTQKITITPQLRQAIKLLELSTLELQSYIESELRENPLLSVEDAGGNDAPFDLETAPPREAPDLEIPICDVRDTREPSFHDAPDGDTGSWDNPQHSGTAAASPYPVARTGGDSDDYDTLASLAPAPTLGAHLREQAVLAFADAQDKFIAEYLIDLVDANGYVRSPIDEVAATLAVDPCLTRRVLEVLQTFDPPGVCATSLAECLALQLKEKNRFDPLMERLLGHLDLIASCDFMRLKKICGVDAEDLEDMISELRQLNPKPGATFEKPAVETLIPDVIVRRTRDGGWRVELNPASAPAISVDRVNYSALKARCRTDTERAYLTERFSAANWLAKSLEQRLATILKVAEALVEEQSAFFNHGVRHLKPINLRHIAAKIGMHESTVSRVTSNKAMATPRGLFEMRYFFTSSIQPTGHAGTAHSSEAVRDRIRELISNERPDDVLSDDRIVTMLRVDSIDIARRTVAKYRDALRIPSSAARRRKKRQPDDIHAQTPLAAARRLAS